MQEGGRGCDSDDDGRRLRARLHRLARHAQRRARAVEGRDPLPPGRHPRRGEGARDGDDVEMRADEPPVRRREGRRRLRPEDDVDERARADDAPSHLRDRQRDRAGEGHPRARCRHDAAGDGVDLRHVLDEPGPLGAFGGDGEAADDRRLARPRGSDRPRRPLLPAGSTRQGEHHRRGAEGRGPGLRQRRLGVRTARLAARCDGDRDLGLLRRRSQQARDRRRGRDRAQARRREARRARRG